MTLLSWGYSGRPECAAGTPDRKLEHEFGAPLELATSASCRFALNVSYHACVVCGALQGYFGSKRQQVLSHCVLRFSPCASSRKWQGTNSMGASLRDLLPIGALGLSLTTASLWCLGYARFSWYRLVMLVATGGPGALAAHHLPRTWRGIGLCDLRLSLGSVWAWAQACPCTTMVVWYFGVQGVGFEGVALVELFGSCVNGEVSLGRHSMRTLMDARRLSCMSVLVGACPCQSCILAGRVAATPPKRCKQTRLCILGPTHASFGRLVLRRNW